MEQYNIKNLPDGTLEKLKARARKLGFVTFAGSVNLAAYLRNLIEKDLKK